MAKERNLPSKTTLTTSDYIRVVGSDNASYKQNMSSVMETMGLKYADLGSFSTQSALETELNTKLNAMPINSTAYIRFSTSAAFGVFQNGVTYICDLRKGGSATYASISLHGLGINAEVVGNKASTTWTFQKEPTRAEMDDVKDHGTKIGTVGNTTGSVNMRDAPGGQTVVTTVPVGAKVFVIGGATNGSYKCLYLNTATVVWYQGYIVTQLVTIE